MKTVAIVAGGDLTEAFLPEIKKQDITIGVDRGAWWLLEQGITPQYTIGDFDSITREELNKLKNSSPNVVQYKEEKNETDLELAVQLANSLNFEQMLIFGAIGSRIDHSLAGIFLLDQFEDKDIELIDPNNRIRLITRTTTLEKDEAFQYISFIPLSAKAIISLKGFKYPLDHYTVYRNKTLGVSNEFQDKKGTITIHEGKLFAIRSKG